MAAGKPAPTRHEVHPIIANRWSGRAIDADTPVPRELLLQMLEAARWAPSCFGDEPWRYLLWDRFRDEDGWKKAADCLWEKNRRWAGNAPVLMASLADSEFDRNGKPNRWGQHDTGAASVSLQMQGVELGFVVHQMGGFDKDQLAEAFAIPDRYTPMAMIAIGYPAPVDRLEEDFRTDELGERDRRPMKDSIFEGGWENRLSSD